MCCSQYIYIYIFCYLLILFTLKELISANMIKVDVCIDHKVWQVSLVDVHVHIFSVVTRS